MSEAAPQEKKVDRLTEVKNTYANLALKAGNLAYEVACKTKDLELVYQEMRNANFEYVAAKNEKDKADAEEAAKAKAAAETKEGSV